MYRIMQARNGCFYVQQDYGSTFYSNWSRCSPFFPRLSSAEAWVRQKKSKGVLRRAPVAPTVIGYY